MSKHAVECLVMMRAIWNIQKWDWEMHVAEDDILTRLLTSNTFWARIHTITRHMVSKTLYCELKKCWWKTTNRLRPWNPDCGKRSIFVGERQSSALVLLKKSLRSRVINLCKRPLQAWQGRVLFCNGSSVYCVVLRIFQQGYSLYQNKTHNIPPEQVTELVSHLLESFERHMNEARMRQANPHH